MKKAQHWSTRALVGISLFTAIVVVLQLLGSFIRFGPFCISVVALPIVIGAAVYGGGAGAWLGFVFGMTVLLSGQSALFLAVSPLGTVITVLLKGICCGAAAELVYKLLAEKNTTLAATAAAIACPIVNTGVFLLGCLVFFMPTMREWASGMGLGEHVGLYMITGLVGANFLIEMAVDVVLCPMILRLIRMGKKESGT